MTWYTFFKSVHVITAAIWVGGAAMFLAYAFRILGTGDGRRQAEFS
jgi:putative copper export protein